MSKATTLNLIISNDDAPAKGERADKVLSRMKEFPSRSQLKTWFFEGRIRRGLEALEPDSLLFPGDKIEWKPLAPKPLKVTARKIPLDILYQDDDLIVIHKPKGLSMHPGASRDDRTTLVHGLLALSKNLSTQDGEFRPGIVHRLDKDTEGVVVIAKNNEIHEALSQQFQQREIERAYFALCWGKPPVEMMIDQPIGRHPVQRKKMAVTAKGKPAKTSLRLIRHFSEGYSLVECKLHSGRTHQIRVHLSSKGYGILGDPVYARKREIQWSNQKEDAYKNLKGQALIAYKLGFVHPRTKEKLLFQVDYPEWMKPFLQE